MARRGTNLQGKFSQVKHHKININLIDCTAQSQALPGTKPFPPSHTKLKARNHGTSNALSSGYLLRMIRRARQPTSLQCNEKKTEQTPVVHPPTETNRKKNEEEQKLRGLIQLVHLTKLAHPVLSHPLGHLAEYHGLVLVAEDVLGDLDLQVELLTGEVAEEYVQRLLAPARGCAAPKSLKNLLYKRGLERRR